MPWLVAAKGSLVIIKRKLALEYHSRNFWWRMDLAGPFPRSWGLSCALLSSIPGRSCPGIGFVAAHGRSWRLMASILSCSLRVYVLGFPWVLFLIIFILTYLGSKYHLPPKGEPPINVGKIFHKSFSLSHLPILNIGQIEVLSLSFFSS